MNKKQNQIIKNWRQKLNQLMAKKILNEKTETNKPETITITQTEYDNLVDFWNEHHS